jgi:TolB-like protein
LNREARLDVAEGLRLGRDVGLALDYAHRRGVVHRDVKPENILLSDGQALLADFGIAQSIQKAGDPKLTTGGLTLRTPMYMSPEQAIGERELDGRSDVYSLAAVLFEALTGTPPFAGATPHAVIAKRFTDPIPSARIRCEGVPESVDRALQRALAPDPEARFPSAAEFVRALTAPEPSASVAPTGSQPSDGVGVSPCSSIAVLPFTNMSMDPANEYFSDGITEELMDALAHVPDLKVAGRRSAFSYKGSSLDLRTIAAQLGVATIVEGSVRRAGDRVRITAQLVSATDGHTMWSEHYDRELRDIFELQEAIAAAIVAALRPRLHQPSFPVRFGRPPADPKAYETLLKGRYFLQLVPEGVRQAVRCYEQAIGQDPHFARAHAGLAGAYLVCALYSLMRPRDAFPRARVSAGRGARA